MLATIPSVARQPIVDSCGAGDMVLAAIGVGLARGMDWLTACTFANLAAGVKCGKAGAVPVTMDQIAQFQFDRKQGEWEPLV